MVIFKIEGTFPSMAAYNFYMTPCREITRRVLFVKRFLLPLAAVLLTMVMIIPSAMHISAADTSSDNIPDNAVVTYGYLEVFKEQLKQEILDELTAEGGITASTPYSDISAKEGQVIILSKESELIYRGGGAIVITYSDENGTGIMDMSAGTELFSGHALEYGHIYYSAEENAKTAILITGSIANFTVRGDHEIH